MGVFIVWALLGTLGYAVITNMKPADAALASLGGALAWASYSAGSELLHFGVFSYLMAALAAGVYAEVLASLRKKPATIYAIPAVISLVPGGGMYYTLSAALSGDGKKAASLGLETLLIAGFMAAGIAISSAIALLLEQWAKARKSRAR
jgi:uncharacterized membrane protein YjjB (DUF3815 family)